MLSNSLIADVNVITKGRYSNKRYTYTVPDNLIDRISINDLVTIQFNNRETTGIVKMIRSKSLSTEISYSHVKNILSNIDPTLLEYIEKVSDFYINPIGHTIHYYFNKILDQKRNTKYKAKSYSMYHYGRDCRKTLIINLESSALNIIYCPSIKSIEMLSDYLNIEGINIIFKQKSGGAVEQEILEEKITENDSGVIISLTTSIFNPQISHTRIYKHYWDINHYKYNENRKPNFNLIQVSNIQNAYTHHKHIYYGEFPNYRYAVRHENIKFELPPINIKYFYGNTITDAVNSLVSHENENIYAKGVFNLDYCSKVLKNKIEDQLTSDTQLSMYSESSKVSNVNILVEPTVSYNKVLNSDSLSRLIRYIYILAHNESNLYILTTNNIEMIHSLSQGNVNKWLSSEFKYREKYGPNYRIKVLELFANTPLVVDGINLIGPLHIREDNTYKYQLTYDYNESFQQNFYEKLKKFDYSFINYF